MEQGKQEIRKKGEGLNLLEAGNLVFGLATQFTYMHIPAHYTCNFTFTCIS